MSKLAFRCLPLAASRARVEPLETRRLLSFVPIDLTPYANFRMQNNGFTTSQYPFGNVTLGGVPFTINAAGKNEWRAQDVIGPNPRKLTVHVGIAGVSDVRTLINTGWGTARSGLASIEFVGSAGADYVKLLVGNTDIRDLHQNVFTDKINGTSSVNVFTTTNGKDRLDMQKIALPAVFLTQTLDHIIFIDRGANGVQRMQVNGLTVIAAPPSAITGRLFNDTNANGKLDAGEKALAGAKIYIDGNKNGVQDAGETVATSDANGAYTITGLAAGTYQLREVTPVGFQLTAPATGFFDVTLTAGQTSPSENFFIAPATASISGKVFDDVNRNGIRDGEAGLGLFKVFIDANNDGVLQSTEKSVVTDIFGNWSLNGLTAGKYTVRVVQVAGIVPTKPAGGVTSITLSAGQVKSGALFGEKAIA